MLTELSLENFKSWARVGKMRLAPLTGLFRGQQFGEDQPASVSSHAEADSYVTGQESGS